jgi:predicted AlkP superfamily pyrophosphatase or phosphodiesterase
MKVSCHRFLGWSGAVSLLVLASRIVAAEALPPPGRILILISLDGFRWDYLQKYQAPNLSRLAAEGVHAERLIPMFPSMTFPNHHTIVTGMRRSA